MKTITKALLATPRSGRVKVGCLGLFVLASGVVAASGAARPSEAAVEGVWITLGADAFDSLLAMPDLDFDNQPLQRSAAAGDVVLTRVENRDLPRISGELHREHRRCAGFMAHPSRERADQELARIAGGPRADVPAGTYTIDQTALVQRLEGGINQVVMLNTIDALSNDFNNRFHGHPSGTAAAQWLFEQWQGYAQGRPDVTVELYTHAATGQPSVLLTIDGVTLPDEVVVLGAHLDSIASGSGNPDFLAPGADDDASGVMVLSETIRVAMADGFRPRRTVQFMAYAAEEVGLFGSGEIANAYQQAGIEVVGVLQLDMTAYFGSVQDIGILNEQWTDNTLTAFLGELIDFYQPELTWAFTACGYGCSDHAAWDANGYPAAMAFESLFGQHNPTIHSSNDTLATLGDSVAHAYKFARLAVAFLAEVAKQANVEIFADDFESGTTDLWSVAVP